MKHSALILAALALCAGCSHNSAVYTIPGDPGSLEFLPVGAQILRRDDHGWTYFTLGSQTFAGRRHSGGTVFIEIR